MRFTLLIVCALLSAGLQSGPADARSRDRDRARGQEQQRPDALRDDRPHRDDRGDRSGDAARRAQQQNGGGRVLSVDPEGGGYRVKVLKDGEVRTHHVDVED